jgi:hypothetical protein
MFEEAEAFTAPLLLKGSVTERSAAQATAATTPPPNTQKARPRMAVHPSPTT